MSSRYSVCEPHPSVPRSGGYIMGGRGGAGNYHRYKAEDLTSGHNATGPASRISLTRPFKRTMTTGRGGMGNTITETEENIFQFDEEMLKARETAATPVYRIGRGGAGNTVQDDRVSSSSLRKNSTSSSASDSSDRPANTRRESGMFSSIFSRRSS
ncbi:hypothetical protein CB0940_07730 [Cercospora beticola]|uniref:Uncharacterized protein n=2 Tax=Cercospora beticola TaxID=122368 RepID=A0A2G5H9I2_CERBT|nr:hypothetical protein CB0940_07730 [Cercospora beticola]PIA88892.1 hypothetical protein CB0940_07730 [Cercospora beticola]CAK1357541.1 unnamed protein product [Cercospora beticola]